MEKWRTYRIYDFNKKHTEFISDDLREVIRYFNTEGADWNNCLIQEWNEARHEYLSIV